jgi:maleate isomerase
VSLSDRHSQQILALARQLMTGPADTRPQALAILCTNLRGAPLAPELERELGIPVYDSIATVVWKALQLTNVDIKRVKRWGSLFDHDLPPQKPDRR